MIELTNIKATDTVGQLRGQINTMQEEIIYNQPMIGACVNPSVYLYNDKTLVYYITNDNAADYQENVTNYLNAVILPSDMKHECFVVGFTGLINFIVPANVAAVVSKIVIDIQSIKGIITADKSYSYSRFITPDRLGLNHKVDGTAYLMHQICRYTHITKEGQATVPPYMADIGTSKKYPNSLDITLRFDKSNLDFTNGATGFISF